MDLLTTPGSHSNTTREHVWSFLSPKYKALMNPET
jgi:hypothetical protein